MDLGIRIRTLRKKFGHSQKDVAKATGVAQTTLSGWENNKFEPTFSIAIKLANYFGISLEELSGRKNNIQ